MILSVDELDKHDKRQSTVHEAGHAVVGFANDVSQAAWPDYTGAICLYPFLYSCSRYCLLFIDYWLMVSGFQPAQAERIPSEGGSVLASGRDTRNGTGGLRLKQCELERETFAVPRNSLCLRSGPNPSPVERARHAQEGGLASGIGDKFRLGQLRVDAGDVRRKLLQ